MVTKTAKPAKTAAQKRADSDEIAGRIVHENASTDPTPAKPAAAPPEPRPEPEKVPAKQPKKDSEPVKPDHESDTIDMPGDAAGRRETLHADPPPAPLDEEQRPAAKVKPVLPNPDVLVGYGHNARRRG